MGTFVGEIRIFAGTFAPAGWMFCQGQLLPISENDTLFNLIGTTYGGDGQTTFALPDLRGRAPMHQGSSYVLGQTGGVEQVDLTVQEIPSHSHAFLGSTSAASATTPANNVVANTKSLNLYNNDSPDTNTAAQNIAAAGGSQPHDNLQPFLVVNYIISLFGLYPMT